MRIPIAGGALAMALLAAPTASQAQTYPWCSRYDWSTYNCGFSTLQQCLANISGIGGICERNAHYYAQRPEPRRSYRKKQRRER